MKHKGVPVKIALFSSKAYDVEYFDGANQDYGYEITHFETRLRKKTVHLAEGHDAVCVFVNDVLDSEVMVVLQDLGIKLIALRCAGFNNVDLEAAARAGIRVVRVPAYSPEAVAEHALALILTLNRKTHKAYNRVRDGNFSLEKLTGFNLADKTVGVIGTGKIGMAFARIMTGMGCRVLGSDPHPDKSMESERFSYTDLDTLLSESDIISLHCPLNQETSYLINSASIEKMKPGVMLINTSRGGLLNTHDVIDSLKRSHVGYLGIDVYEQEEKLFFKDRSGEILQDDQIARLMTFPNVLITAHQAFFTREALMQISHTTLENLRAFFNRDELVNEVRDHAV